MSELARPFVRLWSYVEENGGYPGQMLFLCAVIMMAIGVLTWYGNKR